MHMAVVFTMYVCEPHVYYIWGGQKRASEPPELPWQCWELNTHPLENQQVLLTTEQFL